jgi:protein TonB
MDSDSGALPELSLMPRVAQADPATPNVSAAPSTKSAPGASSTAIMKWQKALVAHLAHFKRYPAAQGSTAEAIVSLAFTIDRKGNVLSSRIEKTSGPTVLDAEALALVKRADPFPPPPAAIADTDLSFVVPIRFTAGEQR